MRRSTYAELELVEHWRAYLADPTRYLRHVLSPDAAAGRPKAVG